ncbi:hypothetical protein COCVIDRAFT_111159, partial [Bipolaris victoriae FI3]
YHALRRCLFHCFYSSSLHISFFYFFCFAVVVVNQDSLHCPSSAYRTSFQD